MHTLSQGWTSSLSSPPQSSPSSSLLIIVVSIVEINIIYSYYAFPQLSFAHHSSIFPSIQRVIKYTPHSHPDYDHLQRALHRAKNFFSDLSTSSCQVRGHSLATFITLTAITFITVITATGHPPETPGQEGIGGCSGGKRTEVASSFALQ